MTTIPLRVFILGMLWALIYAMVPVGIVLWRWISLWQDPPDMRILGPLALTCAAMGVGGYWRKYSALLELPPDLQRARELAQQVTVVTTVETVEKQMHPPSVKTTTVETTETTK